jgi:hypothetical protein
VHGVLGREHLRGLVVGAVDRAQQPQQADGRHRRAVATRGHHHPQATAEMVTSRRPVLVDQREDRGCRQHLHLDVGHAWCSGPGLGGTALHLGAPSATRVGVGLERQRGGERLPELVAPRQLRRSLRRGRSHVRLVADDEGGSHLDVDHGGSRQRTVHQRRSGPPPAGRGDDLAACRWRRALGAHGPATPSVGWQRERSGEGFLGGVEVAQAVTPAEDLQRLAAHVREPELLRHLAGCVGQERRLRRLPDDGDLRPERVEASAEVLIRIRRCDLLARPLQELVGLVPLGGGDGGAAEAEMDLHPPPRLASLPPSRMSIDAATSTARARLPASDSTSRSDSSMSRLRVSPRGSRPRARSSVASALANAPG